ncbi:hypothetical protein BDQ17DRAFT_1380236 [Cyathus striatus]|nr:hypothetical protein BDQ17DRAFT_1380236 [Cyathus striatus]
MTQNYHNHLQVEEEISRPYSRMSEPPPPYSEGNTLEVPMVPPRPFSAQGYSALFTQRNDGAWPTTDGGLPVEHISRCPNKRTPAPFCSFCRAMIDQGMTSIPTYKSTPRDIYDFSSRVDKKDFK